MLSYEEALARIDALDLPCQVEELPLESGLGRVLAQEVRLGGDQPGFNRATMDGYAIHLKEGQERFPVRGTVLAGAAFPGHLEAGECVRIMTGAPCPPDVTVVPVERTDGGTDVVHVTETDALQPGRNIAWRGEDGREGDLILEPGTQLGPASLSAAAMAGIKRLTVYRNPAISIVTTGDEIGGTGEASVHNSNGPLLQALVRSLRCATHRLHAHDEEEHLIATLRQATELSPIVVTTGGVSAGTRDLVPDAARKVGFEQVLHKVSVQPGKPLLIGRHPKGRVLLGLPGNPVSVLATAHLFLLRTIGLFWGGWTPHWLELPLVRDHIHRGQRRLFLPGRLVAGGVAPVVWNGSGDLLAAATGDGLIERPAATEVKAGEPVRFLPFVGHVAGQRGLLPGGRSRGDTC